MFSTSSVESKLPTWTSITVQLFNLNISLSLNMKIKKDIGLKLCDNNTSHNVFLVDMLFGIIQYNQNQIKKENLMIFWSIVFNNLFKNDSRL